MSPGRVLTSRMLCSLNEFGMEPAPSFRTVDLGVTVTRNFWASTRPHVCYAACLPAALAVLLHANTGTAGWPYEPGRGHRAASPFLLPATFSRVVIGSSRGGLSARLWRRIANMRPFDVRHSSRSASLKKGCLPSKYRFDSRTVSTFFAISNFF